MARGPRARGLVQPVTLTPWCFSQPGRHFQPKAPFSGVGSVAVPGRRHLGEPRRWEGGAIFETHGSGSCWTMNAAGIERCRLIFGYLGAVLCCPDSSQAMCG